MSMSLFFYISQTAIDECASNPCRNRARCEDQHNGHLCICPTGFLGRYCEGIHLNFTFRFYKFNSFNLFQGGERFDCHIMGLS